MRWYRSDEVWLLKGCARYQNRALVNASQNLPITIIEIGGTIRVYLGGDEDLRSEDLKNLIPIHQAWTELVATFLGTRGTGVTARRAEWRRLNKVNNISYRCLAARINQQAADLVRQEVKAADALAEYNELVMRVRRQMDNLERQQLDADSRLAGYDYILDADGDALADGCERLPDLERQRRMAHEELRTILRAGGYPHDRVEYIMAEAAQRIRNGEPPFEKDEPFTRDRMIDCLRPDRTKPKTETGGPKAAHSRQLLEKAA
jgi:hypothetical protein